MTNGADANTSPPSNFAHLARDFPAVHEAAVSAEGLALSEPVASAILAGKAVELALGWAFAEDGALTPPAGATASAMIHDRGFRRVAGQTIHLKAKYLNTLRNKAAHEGARLSEGQAAGAIKELHHVLHWFGRHYGRAKPPETNPFDPAPLQRRTDVLRQVARRIADADAAIAARDAELEALRANVLEGEAALGAEIARARAAVAEARAEKAREADPHDYGEAETRDRFIDLLLAEAGWTDLRPGRDLEVRVAPMPNEKGFGFADYVLWGADGLPLAVIEAKRARRDPKEGRTQGELYADALQAMHDRRPVVFYTNGYTHWIWDDAPRADGSPGAPPRELGGFKTAEELEAMIRRREQAKPLTSVSPNRKIAGRPYQTRALAKIATSVDAGRRKALLVMATGTGKTRTVIALVDMMMRAGLVSRALFLADRTSLVKQARNAFAAHLPDTSPVNLVTDKQGQGRVYLSTYPTMMNLIDGGGEGARRFGPGHFDLVIIDEAHRSVYKRYSAIFDYFDAHLIGLTATPRDEVDRDTYRLFDLDIGMPTDAYGLDEAIDDGFLVPFDAVSVPTKFLRGGIRYDQLSNEEKDRWDEMEWDDGIIPDEISAGELNKYLFNADTVDKVLAHLMEHGIKVKGGERLGKTILFAANQRHAEFIEERFDAGWPHLAGTFARRITYKDAYAQDLIDRFSQPEKAPHLAISVDMLDTGIDVPEVVNLVFFKLVRSKTKFWQMVGRGTRLRPDLFGPGRDKTRFRIFDFCQNLEFFGQEPEMKEPPVPLSLTERLVDRRLALIDALSVEVVEGLAEEETPFEPHPDAEPTLSDVRSGAIMELKAHVAGMDLSSFVVRAKREPVERWQSAEAPWNAIGETAAAELRAIADLPSAHDGGSEEAKRFDLLMLELQLALLGLSKRWQTCRRQVDGIVNGLSAKLDVPMIARHAELIEAMQSDDWWTGVTVPILEGARRRLRNVVHLVDRAERKILYTDFEDELGAAMSMALGPVDDFADFKREARRFLKAHGDHLSLRRLRAGMPLTATDLAELERMLLEAGIGSPDDIERARRTQSANVSGFGVFVRSLIGFDRKAAQKRFADFISPGASANQIEFVGLVIEHLTRNGVMDPGALYESPFTDRAPDGPDGMLDAEHSSHLLCAIRSVNESAVA